MSQDLPHYATPDTPDFTPKQQRRIKFIDELARVAYTIARAYTVKNDDPKFPAWEQLDYLDSEYAREGVEVYLAAPDEGADAWHNLWFEQMKANGFKYGKKYDAQKKTHPMFLKFNRLPLNKQNSDIIFHAAVRALTTTEARAYDD